MLSASGEMESSELLAYIAMEEITSGPPRSMSIAYTDTVCPVLFKPTMASEEQFRPTFQSALSYFVASNNECPEDSGFAIKGWTEVRFENAGVIVDGIYAIAMGNYFFTDQRGVETKVEYTFGYIQDEEGRLRIQLHHSSIPASAS